MVESEVSKARTYKSLSQGQAEKGQTKALDAKALA